MHLTESRFIPLLFFKKNERKHRLQFQRLHDCLVEVLGFGKVKIGVPSCGLFMLPPVWVLSSALCQRVTLGATREQDEKLPVEEEPQ